MNFKWINSVDPTGPSAAKPQFTKLTLDGKRITISIQSGSTVAINRIVAELSIGIRISDVEITCDFKAVEIVSFLYDNVFIWFFAERIIVYFLDIEFDIQGVDPSRKSGHGNIYATIFAGVVRCQIRAVGISYFLNHSRYHFIGSEALFSYNLHILQVDIHACPPKRGRISYAGNKYKCVAPCFFDCMGRCLILIERNHIRVIVSVIIGVATIANSIWIAPPT